MTATIDFAGQVAAESGWLAVVATCRPDGTIHTSLVKAGVVDDPVTGAAVVGLIVSGSARKLAHLRHSGRAAVTFHAGPRWVSVEGPASVAGPDDPLDGLPSSAFPGLLRAVFEAAGGTHHDWDEYDQAMAGDRRAAVLIQPARVLTNG